MIKIKVIILTMLVMSSIAFGEEIPVDKSFYLFRNNDIADEAMGNTGFIFTTKNSVDTNPAAMANLDKAYYYLGYNHSDYVDGINLTESKNYKSLNYFGASSSTGGFYYRRLKKSGEVEGIARKYEFISNELGLATVKKINSTGFSFGGKLKIYINELDDAKLDGTELKLNREIGYGYAIDAGVLYKVGMFSFALNGDNILGNIYWKNYENVYINSSIKAGSGIEYGVLKYGVSLERILKKGTDTRYGQGLELKIFSIPNTSSSIFKGFSLSMRSGIVSSKFMKSENSKKSYGMELSRDNYYVDILTESADIDIFSSNKNKIYKFAVGAAY